MGPVHNIGLQDRIPPHALLGAQATHPKIQQRPTSPNRTGSSKIKGQRGGGSTEDGTPGQFCVHPVSNTQERWRSKTGHQPQVPELVCGVPTLQNGRYLDAQEPGETERLAGESGSKGCLLLSPDSPGPQEIPVLQSRRENISVHIPPVRPDLSTLDLYQDPQAHSSSGMRVGVSSSNLYRRHTADGGVEKDGRGTRHSLDIYTPVPGFHHKP